MEERKEKKGGRKMVEKREKKIMKCQQDRRR